MSHLKIQRFKRLHTQAAMAKAILAGTPIAQVMGGAYEHMLKG